MGTKLDIERDFKEILYQDDKQGGIRRAEHSFIPFLKWRWEKSLSEGGDGHGQTIGR